VWKSSVRGIILSQTQFSYSNAPEDEFERVSIEVFSMLDDLAWFHRVPVVILAAITTIFCVIRHWKCLDSLDQNKRQKFIDAASTVPLWSLLHKLIGSISLLHYFDNQTISRNSKIASLRP
jgi:hypothetical protein